MKILTQRELIKKLDRIFSEYIRLSKSNNGVCKCCTCGKLDNWKDCDAGHYISRSHLSVRYNEQNVWPQCRACNRFHEGRKDAFALFLLEKFGPDVLKNMDKDKWEPCFNFPFEELINHYKPLVKELKKKYT